MSMNGYLFLGWAWIPMAKGWAFGKHEIHLPGSEAISAWSSDMETSIILYKLYRRWHQCNTRRIIMYYPAVLWGEQRKLKEWTWETWEGNQSNMSNLRLWLQQISQTSWFRFFFGYSASRWILRFPLRHFFLVILFRLRMRLPCSPVLLRTQQWHFGGLPDSKSPILATLVPSE